MRQSDRLIVNILSNYGLTVVAGAASLIVVPLVVKDLTQTGYGLAMMLISGITVTTTLGDAINRAVQRYLPLDLKSADAQRINGTINSAMAMYSVLGLGSAITLFLLRGWYLDDPGINAELKSDGNTAFIIVSIMMLFEGPMLVFQAGIESIQRFDIVGGYAGATSVLRMISIIILFKLGFGSVVVFMCVHMLAMISGSMLYFRRLNRAIPNLQISPKHVNRATLKLLAVFAGAGLLTMLGLVLGQEGFRVLVGKGLSIKDVGGLSVVWAFRSMASMIVCSMTNVLTPTASALDARGLPDSIGKLMISSTKYSSLVAISTCLVPLAAFGPFLRLWLGDEFGSLEPLLIVVMLALIPMAASTSAQQILIGIGRLKVTSTAALARGALSLLAACLYLYFSANPTLTGAALWLYATQTIFSFIVIVHGGKETQVGVYRLLAQGLVLPLLLGTVASGATWAVSMQLGTHSWPGIVGSVGVGELVLLCLALAMGLSVEERGLIGSFIGRVKARIMPT